MYMPQHLKFRCNRCDADVIADVPDMDSPFRFGNELPCSTCRNEGCTYTGLA